MDEFELVIPVKDSFQRTANTSKPSHKNSLNRRGSLAVDVSNFALANFKPEYYLQTSLPQDSPELLNATVRSLQVSRDRSIHDLRKNVHKNYPEYVQIAKETARFEENLSQLRSMTTQLRNLSGTLLKPISKEIELNPTMEVSSGEASEGETENAATANSPQPTADLQNDRERLRQVVDEIAGLESAQMQAQLSNRKLLQQGKIGLAMRATESNQWKPVAFYLFQDAVMVASKRQQQRFKVNLGSAAGTPAGKKPYSLERFYSLPALAVQDVAESEVYRNCLKLTVEGGGDLEGPLILQTESPAAKKHWLETLTKAKRALQSIERIGTPAAVAEEPKFSRRQRLKSPTAATPKPEDDLLIFDVSNEKYDQLVRLLDSLNEHTSLAQYQEAVAFADRIRLDLADIGKEADAILKGSKEHRWSPRLRRLQRQWEGLHRKLMEYLFTEIGHPLIEKAALVEAVQWLIILGFADEAREYFLTLQSETIRYRQRSLIYTGDCCQAVNDLSLIVFTGIRKAADWFQAAFQKGSHAATGAPPLTAAFMFWARAEIAGLVQLITRQVFRPSSDLTSIGKAVGMARDHCEAQLGGTVGMDFTFYLDELMAQEIDGLLEEHFEGLLGEIDELIAADPFQPVPQELEEENKEISDQDLQPVTSSMLGFQKIILDLLNSFHPIINGDQSALLIQRIIGLFEAYMSGLLEAFYKPNLSLPQQLQIVGNVRHMASHFCPSIQRQVSRRYDKSFASLGRLGGRLEAAVLSLYNILMEICSERWTLAAFSSEHYQAVGDLVSDAGVSNWVIDMLPQRLSMAQSMPPLFRLGLLQSFTTQLLGRLKSHVSSLKFGSLGIQQFILDLTFILKAFQAYLTPEAAELGQSIAKAALDSYTSGGEKLRKSAEWFDRRASVLAEASQRMLEIK